MFNQPRNWPGLGCTVSASNFRALSWAACLMAALSFCMPAQAAMQDEIQVYTDDINDPGERGLEMHINTTPRGVTTPSYPGELTNDHGWRLTPEFSLGLTKTTDIGLYVPTTRANDGNLYAAGLKMRFKWLPIQSQDTGGFFAGINFELGQVRQRFSESPRTGEIRNILGWRSTHWLVVVNPIFGFDASRGFSHVPTLEVATKINRRVSERLSIGWERYNDRGPYNNPVIVSEQGKVNYLVVDVEGESFDVNLGIGKGTTPVSDPWTLKAIVGFSFGK
jgi:hypothetical protein